MEGKLQRLDHESLTQSPLRPQSDLVPAEEWGDETVKQQKPDDILEESGDDGQDDKKGKSIFSSAAKGKGKMAVDEEEGSDVDESGSSDDISDSDCTDDPLTEMDVDNIIPGRIRPRIAVKAGTYRLEGESDEDDHTTDGEEKEEEEEEEEEEEDEGDEGDEGNEEEAENSEGSE